MSHGPERQNLKHEGDFLVIFSHLKDRDDGHHLRSVEVIDGYRNIEMSIVEDELKGIM